MPAPGSYRFGFTYFYWYDSAGNRTKFSRTDKWTTNRISVYEYSQRNELIRYSDPEGYNRYWVFEYDMRGNLTKKYHTYYTNSWYEYYWDSRDKLTKVVNNAAGKTIYFKYDALGRRVAKKVDNGPWHWYFYDGLKVLAEGSDTYDRMFYTLAPGAIGGIICRDGGSKYFYHYDRLGNVVGITDASGNVVRVYHNTAFGIWWSYDSDGYDQEVADVQPYHLTTKEYDSDIGLYYFHARWYARWPGRFISRDPLGGPDRSHVLMPYSYCFNSPTQAIDPTGLASFEAEVEMIKTCRDAIFRSRLWREHVMPRFHCAGEAGRLCDPGGLIEQCLTRNNMWPLEHCRLEIRQFLPVPFSGGGAFHTYCVAVCCDDESPLPLKPGEVISLDNTWFPEFDIGPTWFVDGCEWRPPLIYI